MIDNTILGVFGAGQWQAGGALADLTNPTCVAGNLHMVRLPVGSE